MAWEKVRLGDVSTCIQTGPFGSQLHQSDYSITGTPVVMPKDMIGGKIVEQSIARVEEQHVNRLSRHKVDAGDILYSRRGDVGRCALVTEKEKGWLCGTGCLKVSIDLEKANPKFVFYQLQKPETIGWVVKHAVGATMLNLNTGILESVPVEMPELQEQNKIVDILSAYDDLIENNQKQIKLLEEAAQRLYKQWFIDLKFPGHETTKIVDGLPEGWKKRIISEVCETIGGGTPSTSKQEYYHNGKIPWATPTDLTKNDSLVLLDTEKKITEEGLKNSSAKLLPCNSILMTSRASIGYFAICDFPVCTNQGFISCIPYNSDMFYYLLFNLMCRVDEIKGKATGSTFLEITRREFRNMEIVVPSESLLKKFSKIIEPVVNKIRTVKKEIVGLTQSRDRLLPKLMNNEIEV
ncbi:restriction endonuclease subunit S [Fibrobacter succinogenes]|uniref:restriction endonuclease subunit S n=1 Tax=Fibrobacter succinogenes TaxID=833 RepID=UPI00156855C7|nr:restriction endonuclease subunit S [Fibrobacter succinogenes]